MDPRTRLDEIKQTWVPPKELECSRPREVSLTWAGRILAGLAVALLLGAIVSGKVLYTQASQEQAQRNRLIDSGLNAEGVVTRHWTSGNDPVRYWAEYYYRVEGQNYWGRLSTGRNSWLGLQRNPTLTVRYLPADPRWHLALGYEPRLLPPWVSILVPALLLVVASFVAFVLARQRRLLAEGRPAPAVVTKISRSNEHGQKSAHYVFMAMEGKLVDGRSSPKKNPPAVGSIVNVIYEPDQERHNRTYPLSLVKMRK